jgi:hypothetical protein
MVYLNKEMFYRERMIDRLVEDNCWEAINRLKHGLRKRVKAGSTAYRRGGAKPYQSAEA